MLLPSRPVDVCGDSTSELNRDSFRGVKEIQVVFHDTLDGQGFVGHEVVATGSLFERQTMHHYTDVLLWLASIRDARTP